MKDSIRLDRKEAEDLIATLDQRISDKEHMGIPATIDEERAIAMIRDKLAGRIE